MSVLAASEIARRCLVDPCVPRAMHEETGTSYGLSFCGYDIRLDQLVILDQRNSFVLASTLEQFDMDEDIVGIVHDKSTWARRAVAVQNTVIEPGWRGFLTLELTYHGRSQLVLPPGTPIAQVLFHRVVGDTMGGYAGRYQDQERGPQEAR